VGFESRPDRLESPVLNHAGFPKGKHERLPKPHTWRKRCKASAIEAEEEDSLPTQGPLMALCQTLTGRQPPGRAVGCNDLHLHTGFRPGKGELCGGEGRWGGVSQASRNPKLE
jgi:hypothetical protein